MLSNNYRIDICTPVPLSTPFFDNQGMPSNDPWRALDQLARSNQLPDLLWLGDLFKQTENMEGHNANSDLQACRMNWLARHWRAIVAGSPRDQKKVNTWSINMGKILHGCMQFHDPSVVNALFVEIANTLLDTTYPLLNARCIGSALYGMQSLTWSEGTDAMLNAIAHHVADERCEPLDARAIGNALYGLKSMVPGDGVESILHAIAPHIESNEQLDAQAIANSLYGMRNLMPTDGTEAVLRAIAPHIETRQCERLSAHEISIALYGLKVLTASAGTEAVLRAIARHMESEHRARLSTREISRALYGLKNFTASEGTEAVLRAIAVDIERSDLFLLQEIRQALYGIKYLIGSSGVRQVISILSDHLAEIKQNTVNPYKARGLFAAEILNSLMPYLLSRDDRDREAALDVAVCLDLSDSFIEPDSIGMLCERRHLEKVIFQLVGDRQCNRTYDFRDCSRDLMATCSAMAMGRFLADEDDSPVTLFFCGDSCHLAYYVQTAHAIQTVLAAQSDIRTHWEST
ncbi:MAG: hypothetical protein JWQ00_3193, partial [Noviherbaspirillum sp.]|nr:hypothetical protein [Noviherbaspirillum sp.]